MTRSRFALLASMLIGINAASSALGNFNITIGNATISPSGTATINVTIAATGTSLTALDSFAFRLVITPTNGTQTQLGFTPTPSNQTAANSPQPQPYNNSNYVFYGDSLNASSNTPLGNVTKTNTPNDTYTGGDATNDGATKPISSTGQLLFSFQVAGISSALPKVGDTFQIALVTPSSSTGGSYNSSTSFTDGTNTSGNPIFVPYTSTAGTVTVAAVVPEPASLLMLSLGVATLGIAPAFRRLCRAA